VSVERHIVASGGGGFADESAPIIDLILRLTRTERPQICFLATASGDSAEMIVSFYEALTGRICEPSHVELFGKPERALTRDHLLGRDAIYVGGGNTANMLAVWRLHGVDEALREAWERGTVLAGWSAGANCWFEASTTDSFGPIGPLYDGLGFLSGSFCPHYDGEAERRPTYHGLVAEGFPGGFAADDNVALHFAGSDLAEVVSGRPEAGAYRVELEDGAVRETPVG
jgi:dipeptidase E